MKDFSASLEKYSCEQRNGGISMKIRGVSGREIEYYLRKREKRLKVKLEYKGNLLEKIKIDEEKRKVRKKNRIGGGATRKHIDFLA